MHVVRVSPWPASYVRIRGSAALQSKPVRTRGRQVRGHASALRKLPDGTAIESFTLRNAHGIASAPSYGATSCPASDRAGLRRRRPRPTTCRIRDKPAISGRGRPLRQPHRQGPLRLDLQTTLARTTAQPPAWRSGVLQGRLKADRWRPGESVTSATRCRRRGGIPGKLARAVTYTLSDKDELTEYPPPPTRRRRST